VRTEVGCLKASRKEPKAVRPIVKMMRKLICGRTGVNNAHGREERERTIMKRQYEAWVIALHFDSVINVFPLRIPIPSTGQTNKLRTARMAVGSREVTRDSATELR
jgi:hypothetical protein